MSWTHPESYGVSRISDALVIQLPGSSHEYDKIHYDYDIRPAKPGKTIMTIAFTGENGEPVTLQKELLVKKYSGAIKNLKVNGKKVKIKGTRKYEYSVKNKKSSGRVKKRLEGDTCHQYSQYRCWRYLQKLKHKYYEKKHSEWQKIQIPQKMG